jgi:hypothetical protein
VRAATLGVLVGLVGLVVLAACNDVRDFAGDWRGDRAGVSPAVRVGEGVSATLTIAEIDKHGLRGHVVVLGNDPAVPLVDADVSSLEPAEADALATMTFSGAPLRVYLGFVPTSTGGDALAVIALYDSHRIELRLIARDAYAIYALAQTD